MSWNERTRTALSESHSKRVNKHKEHISPRCPEKPKKSMSSGSKANGSPSRGYDAVKYYIKISIFLKFAFHFE